MEVGGEPDRSAVDELWASVRAGPPRDVADLIDRELLAGHGARGMLPAVPEGCRRWRPALVAGEPCGCASAATAHQGGISLATVGISAGRVQCAVLRALDPDLDRHAPELAAAIADAPSLTPLPFS